MIETSKQNTSYKALQEISKTLTKSREVVNQSKSLYNKLNFSGELPHSEQDNFKSELNLLDESASESSHHSPTIKGFNLNSSLAKENSTLRRTLIETQAEVRMLEQKLKEKDTIIKKYEEIFEKLTNVSGYNNPDHIQKVSLKLRKSSKETNTLENKLAYISEEYNKQILINNKLTQKLKDISLRKSEIKLNEIKEKVIVSSDGVKNISDRLRIAEDHLSKAATPIPQKLCHSKSTQLKVSKKKKNPTKLNIYS